MRLFTLLFCLMPLMSIAADPSKPHSHKGKVQAYAGEPPVITLTPDQIKTINAGETAYTQTAKDAGGSAVAVFKVNGSPEAVRKIIRDLKDYPKWIDSLKEIEVYETKGDTIKAKFTIEVKKLFITKRITYFIEHSFPLSKDKSWGTWKLDYGRESDLDDSVGFWRIEPLSGNPNQSLVFYSVNIRVGGFLDLFKGMIADEGLKEATQWVKKAAAALPVTPPSNIAVTEKESAKIAEKTK
jgi:hypothetical protein